MLKKTLFFSHPYFLSVKNEQLIAHPKEEGGRESSVPIEDIGFIVLENSQIGYTQYTMQKLIENNVAVVFCNTKHNPIGMVLNLDTHHLQSEIFASQIKASEPLKKNLWKQTVISKIKNQQLLLKKLGKEYDKLTEYINSVKSGDSDNREAVASRVYWGRLFRDDDKEFRRERKGKSPNNMLNYGYAILRAATARSLIGSGLLPTLGINHHNRYNAFCLADDIMEPYRPFVDEAVYQLNIKYPDTDNLTTEIKADILTLLACDVKFETMKRPLMVGLTYTSASVARCFAKESKKIIYPSLE